MARARSARLITPAIVGLALAACGRSTPSDARAARPTETRMTAPIEGLPLPSCAEVRAVGQDATTIGDAFYKRYPKALAGERSVETVALGVAEIDGIVDYLACVAEATAYDPVVVENGLALFASKRHGAAALARLDALAARPGKAGEAAGRFRKQVRAYLAG